MEKVLITGIAGLLGSHFSRYLLELGYDVYGIDNLSGGYIDFIDERIIKQKKIEIIDLNDQERLQSFFENVKPDYVYHFAAYAAEGLSPFIRNFNYNNNLICTTNIVNNCIKYSVKKLIFTSSMSVYGDQIPPFIESQVPNPIDPYAISKFSAEMDIRQAYEQFQLNYTIIRPHNVIGIYQNIWDKYRNVIGIWIRKCLESQDITVFGDGLQKRAFSDIKFYLEPFRKVMYTNNGEIFNIGADNEIEILEAAKIVQKISRKHGFDPKIIHLEERHEVKFAYCDHSKAKKLLDFIDDTNLENTIDEMFIWANKQPKREVKKMNYEIEKNIYSFWK